MKIIFCQEGEDDQESIYQFLSRNKIEQVSSHPKVRIDYEDFIATFFKATNGKYYFEFNSCGYQLTLAEMDSEDELNNHLKMYLVKCRIITKE